MATKDINIAIAEHQGAVWLEVPPEENYMYRPKRLLSFYKWDFNHPRCAPLPFPDPNGDATDTPRYTEDMKAMQKVEDTLQGADRILYHDTLCGRLGGEEIHGTFAKAKERAETYCEIFKLL